MRITLSLLITIFMYSAGASQDWNCADPGNLPQQGMNHCAFLDFEKADQRLNATWKNVFPKIRAHDRGVDKQWQGWPAATRKAQRAWITYRDAHCTSQRFKYRGGTIEPLIYQTCRTKLTNERIKQLQRLLEDG